jgi:oxidase EvaA
METWRDWLRRQREEGTMVVEQIPLCEVTEPWGNQTDGNYGRKDGQFFKYIGVKISVPKGREVVSWQQPMKIESGPGSIVLVVNENDEVLVTTRIEPGNPNEVDMNYILLGPTIQASKSNLEQAHGGKRPLYSELLDREQEIKRQWTGLWQDGGRDYKKLNYYAIIRVKKDEITLIPSARWFTEEEIAGATLSGDINEHLSQALHLLTCKKRLNWAF